MSAQNAMVNAVDSDEKRFYRVGGISAFILGIAYIVTIPLYASAGALPNGGEARLIQLVGNTKIWWAILGLMVFTDFLFVPIGLSLYLALKRVDKCMMLLATSFVGLFIVLDLAITWPNHASLIGLSHHYATAANDAKRLTYVSAANYADSVLASPLIGIYAILTLSLGILITSLVMRKGIFNKMTAYLGFAAGISGFIAVAGSPFISALSVFTYINAFLVTVWVFFIGVKFCRLGWK
jgi:hypothetical protein